jgi:hypothetical protein
MSQRLSVVAAAAAIALSACTVKQSDVASVTGPSVFATSVDMSAVPDTLVLNGQQSVITLDAHDVSGAPLANLHVHLAVIVADVATSCGGLTPSDVVTNSAGHASAIFTAPSTPLPKPECSGLGSTVQVQGFAIGTDAAVHNSAGVSLNLLTPTTAAAPNAFAVNFSTSPNPAITNAPMTFSDAGSVSPGHVITTYDWSFGDGTPHKFGANVVHDFGSAGTYVVTLTITDDIGQSGSKSGLVTVKTGS